MLRGRVRLCASVVVIAASVQLVVGCTCSSDSEQPGPPVPFPRSSLREPGGINPNAANQGTTSAHGIDQSEDIPGAANSDAPRVLFVPDAAIVAATGNAIPEQQLGSMCPAEMVSVRGQFCIDRYEAVLVDAEQAREISPYYHPTFFQTKSAYTTWNKIKHDWGPPEVRLLPLPEPPEFQLRSNFDIRAVVRRGAIPNAYVSGNLAERACRNANKRLCREEEWVVACRGEADRQFPYGDGYEARKCNVFNGVHPALILHGDASSGHLDPRLNHFAHNGASLLHATGTNPECASRWGNDAIYDMVGNLDEWVDDADGTFLGGFYARNTKDGCLSRISAHPRAYFDYSLGIRCCL